MSAFRTKFPPPVSSRARAWTPCFCRYRRESPRIFSPRAKSLIRRIFSRRRKQLGSIAKGLGGDSEAVFGWLGASGIDPRTRPEAVPLPLWELLDETVSEGEK